MVLGIVFLFIFAYSVWHNGVLIFASGANVATNKQQQVQVWETGVGCELSGGTERVVGNTDHCFLQHPTERDIGNLVNLQHYSPAEFMNILSMLKEWPFHITEYRGQAKSFNTAFSVKCQVPRAAEVLAHWFVWGLQSAWG